LQRITIDLLAAAWIDLLHTLSDKDVGMIDAAGGTTVALGPSLDSGHGADGHVVAKPAKSAVAR
jgi:hypothetical protein